METRILRSRRRTMGLEMKAEGLIVRVPWYATEAAVRRFIRSHEAWINKQWQKVQEREKKKEEIQPLSREELRALAEEARRVIPERAAFYAPLIGVSWGRITIRSQRTKWGSCSSKGNLNFNCLLMLAPPEVLDSVVVHELCHLKEMNHSARFYAQVLKVFPEYKKWDRWLKENGDLLLARLGKA